jgi:uncharacterized membrane protein
MIFSPFSLILLLLFILFLPFFFFIIQIEIIKIAFSKLGLSPHMAFFIIFLSLIGSLINIPVSVKEATIIPPAQNHLSFLSHPFGMPDVPTKQIIAINLGGCIIPLLLCLYLLPKAAPLPTFFATAVSVLVCFKLARVVPGMGIRIPAFIPPLVAVILAYLFCPSGVNRIPVAYISGVMGVLIGADILNLTQMGSYPGVMSIGGAGVFDGIFLVGIFSVLLA